jgi:rhamnosyl/mannosyltransferase
MAMTEAMANGLPAISTALGTATDWVNLDGCTGFVVPPNDVVALTVAIEKLRDGRLRARLGAQAAQRATALFSFDEHIADLEEIYHEAMT